jgi:hypothetical protein
MGLWTQKIWIHETGSKRRMEEIDICLDRTKCMDTEWNSMA